MSLISEALKKAQQEREKNRDSEDLSIPEPPPATDLFPRRRIVFIASLVLLVIVALMVVYLWYQPSTVPQMQALNIKPPSPTTTQPQPQPKPIQPTPAEKPIQPIPTEKPIPKSQPQLPPAQDSPHKSHKSPTSHKSQNPITPTPPKTIQSGVKLQKEPPPTPPAPMDAAAYTVEGDHYMEKNNPILAVEEYKKALALNPSADLYLKLYAAFKALKNPVLMRAYVDEGLSSFPRDYYLNKISAVLYIRAKDFRKAQLNITAALAVDPGDYAIHTYQGLCYFHTGNFNSALTAFQESLQINSDALENYYYIGLIFDNQKQYAKALEYYTAFIKLNTGNENFMHRDWVIERVKLLNQNNAATPGNQ